jgi:hypothetical protein
MRAFIRKCSAIAGALVFAYGDINQMIANAEVVITQQSTCTYVALALDKEVHTNLNIEELKKLMPIQNDGVSAEYIARICERILHTSLEVLLAKRKQTQPRLKRERVTHIDLLILFTNC